MNAPRAQRPRRRRVIRDDPAAVATAAPRFGRPSELPATGPGGDFVRGLDRAVEREPRYCPGCDRRMSDREAAEQGACNDCYGGAWDPREGER